MDVAFVAEREIRLVGKASLRVAKFLRIAQVSRLKKRVSAGVNFRERVRGENNSPTAVARLDGKIDRSQHRFALSDAVKIICRVIFASWNLYSETERHVVIVMRFGREHPHISRYARIAHAESARGDRKSTRLNSSHVSESRMP